MKKYFKFLIVSLFLGSMLISCNHNIKTNQDNESKFTKLSGAYLGQKPPGMMVELFAPDLLLAAGENTYITFSPDGMEFSYTIYTAAGDFLVEPTGVFRKWFMIYSHVKNGHWTEPKEFLFTPARQSRYLFFSPDGKKIFFNSKKNKTNPPGGRSSLYIWYSERQAGDWQWSESKKIDFGKDYYKENLRAEIFPSVASNGNLYFFQCPDRQNGVILMSKYEKGKYSLPEKLSDAVNAPFAAHPYIAPDESYLIFDSNGDLFISFRDNNGNWMERQNMGERINTGYLERRPFVSFDGKYLFFASDRINPELPNEPITLKQLQQLTNMPANGFQHLYWVDAKVIEELKPEHLK